MLEQQKSPLNRILAIQFGKKTYRFHKNRIKIGSVESSDIRITGEGMSPIHAVIELVTDSARQATSAAIVYDIASEGGVFFGGKKVITQALKSGDSIEIGGKEITIRVEELGVNSAPTPSAVAGPQQLFYRSDEDLKPLRLESPENVEEIFDYRYSNTPALEVILSWKGLILDVQHFVVSRQVLVGPEEKADFLIPPFLGARNIVLAQRESDGFTVQFQPGMQGVAQTGGRVAPITESIKLKPSDFAKISMGDVDFYLSETQAPPHLKRQRMFDKDPFFARIMGTSLVLSGFLIYLLCQIPIEEPIEAEKLPERVATILYQPEKFSYPERKEIEKQIKAQSTPPQTPPTPKTPPKLRMADKNQAQQGQTSDRVAPKFSQRGKADGKLNGAKLGQNQAKEGAGARHIGPEGMRGSKRASPGAAPQDRASRPSPQPGKGLGGGQSQVADLGNIEMLKSAQKEMLNLLGGSAEILGKKGAKLKGYGAFDTKGEGGQALSGTGSGGGGTSTSAYGLADKGRGGGKVGTGLGAVGSGSNIIGGQVRVELRRGGAEESVIMGSIDRNAVLRALEAHRDEFRLCYEREINQGSPYIEGRVGTSFVIGPSGRVTQAAVRDSTLKNANAESCILSVIRRIDFPEPAGGGIVEVKFPFKFRPVGGG